MFVDCRVLKHNTIFMAEMYAYSMAAAHENLPHATMTHLIVSNTGLDDVEGWSFIDDLGPTQVCRAPENGTFAPNKPLPYFLHYCQVYALGDFEFYKQLVRSDNIFSLISCGLNTLSFVDA